MSLFLSICILILGLAIYFMERYYSKQLKKMKCYKQIVFDVLNADSKTRQRIEKTCNDYLEHKVINSKFVNDEYLAEIKLLLDDLKYINAIKSVEPFEEKKKESKIEEALNNNLTETNNKSKKTKKEEE